MNRIDVRPRNHEKVVLGGRVAVLEGDVIFVLGRQIRMGVVHLSSAHLEEDVEKLLRRWLTEDPRVVSWVGKRPSQWTLGMT